MFTVFKQHLESDLSFLQDAKLLLATSGGIDSVVMAHLCHRLQLKFALAHCNFALRGNESDLDQAFVEKLAKTWKVAIFTKRFDTTLEAEKQKTSIQMAARALRYAWFEDLAATEGFDYIITAHHADDQLETFLINLSRGTGIEGLKGIPETNGKIARPLLPFSREAIVAYAEKEQLQWREDRSNAETKYLRNKLRHEVIPALKELNPKFLQHFIQTTQYLSGTHNLAQKHVQELKVVLFNKKKGTYQIPVSYLERLRPQEAYLYAFFSEYGFTEWNDLRDLLSAQSGKQLFSATHRLLKDREYLFLQEIKEEDTAPVTVTKKVREIQWPLPLRFQESDGDYLTTPAIAYIDKEKLKYPLTIRKWKNGDYFYPLGMQGKKKLSEFFRDEKYSLIDKEQQWLLCSEDQIVWVIGKRLDERFKVTEETQSILQVKLL